MPAWWLMLRIRLGRRTITVKLQVLVLPQASLTSQVRVMANGQGPLLVTVLKVSYLMIKCSLIQNKLRNL